MAKNFHDLLLLSKLPNSLKWLYAVFALWYGYSYDNVLINFFMAYI
jgi:hypothetical protein